MSAVVRAVSIAACLSEIDGLFTITLGPNYRLKLQVCKDLPALNCDPDELKVSIIALLLNACNAMPGGGTVVVSAGRHPSGEGVAISVDDHGIGMTDETISRALEPFFTTKTTGLGGLGLPGTVRFAEAAGGQILVESKLGVGTIVTLQLPAASVAVR